MSAREDLEQRLIRDAGLSPHWAKRQVDAMLNEHAHGLAEEIRLEADGEWDEPDTQYGMRKSADLIDPEVSEADLAERLCECGHFAAVHTRANRLCAVPGCACPFYLEENCDA